MNLWKRFRLVKLKGYQAGVWQLLELSAAVQSEISQLVARYSTRAPKLKWGGALPTNCLMVGTAHPTTTAPAYFLKA